MGLIGLIMEIVVFCCITGGIICNAYIIGTCDLLILSFGKGSFGPWRLQTNELPDDPNTVLDDAEGCVSWSKDDYDAGTFIVSYISFSEVFFLSAHDMWGYDIYIYILPSRQVAFFLEGKLDYDKFKMDGASILT